MFPESRRRFFGTGATPSSSKDPSLSLSERTIGSVDEGLDEVRAGCLRVALAVFLPAAGFAEVVRFEANDNLACFKGLAVLLLFAGGMTV